MLPSSVNNSRPAGEEVTGTRKKGVTDIGENEEKEKGSEGAIQKRTFNYFPRPRLKTKDMLFHFILKRQTHETF